MEYLIYNTLQDAQTNLNQVNTNMGLIAPASYALIMKRLDDKYVFLKPNDEYMTNVTYESIEVYSSTWFKQEDE